jgi:hypothetical protein
VRSTLHAWAEYVDTDGRWRVVDASVVAHPAGPTAGIDRQGGTAPQSSRSGLKDWFPVAILVIAVPALLVAAIAGRRWRREFRAGDAGDVVGLVRGAAVRPHAFANIHALFSRGLLQSLSGRSISLARARKLAGSGRLACGSRRSVLARRAARRGGVVLDLDSRTSAAAADALAAVNLDRWSELIDRAEDDALTVRVENRLRAVGELCRVAIVDDVGLEMAIFDGSVLSLGSDARWVLVDSESRLWQSLRRLTERWPARATLLLADMVLHRTGAPPLIRHRCLSSLAAEALLEAAGAS